MLQTLMPLIVLLSWLALPVTVVCIVDDWLLRPQRAIAASARTARDAPLMRLLYGALPVLIVAAVLRLLLAERLKAHAWKACVRESVPWVRIPLPPPPIRQFGKLAR